MAIRDALIPEFDMEMANTRQALERVPDDRFGWRPHPKSWTLGQLANHTIQRDSIDIAPAAGGAALETPIAGNREELLRQLVEGAAATRAATLPRIVVLRNHVRNHLIHHRGQFSVYLRLTGVPVPGPYGPSADESGM
jgi:DinB family protein